MSALEVSGLQRSRSSEQLPAVTPSERAGERVRSCNPTSRYKRRFSQARLLATARTPRKGDAVARLVGDSGRASLTLLLLGLRRLHDPAGRLLRWPPGRCLSGGARRDELGDALLERRGLGHVADSATHKEPIRVIGYPGRRTYRGGAGRALGPSTAFAGEGGTPLTGSYGAGVPRWSTDEVTCELSLEHRQRLIAELEPELARELGIRRRTA